MEVRAVAKYIRVQPKKVRQVANEVRGKSAVQSANLLRFHPSKGATVLRKVLLSAMANAEANHGLDASSLKICEIQINEGPKMKRIQARAMGRANRIFKRTSHVTVVVEDAPVEVAVKPHGTKAKARPSLAGKGKKKAAPVKEAKSAAPVEEEVTATSAEAETMTEQVEETVAEEATEAPAEETASSEAEEETK